MEEMLEELMAWLQRCEDTLTHLEAEPLPDDLDQILVLIKVFNLLSDNRLIDINCFVYISITGAQ